MTNAWALSALWVGLALVATLLAIWFKVSTALSEILVGIELETEVVVGHPAEQIIHMADKMQASVIVMGKRSHTMLHRWMIGSNSERVLRYAHCPVMIVH